MPITVRHSDYSIEVANEEELRVVLKVLGEAPQLPLPEAAAAAHNEAPVLPIIDLADAARRGWRALQNRNAIDYLRVLARYPNGINDTRLKQELGLDLNRQLGARTSAVVRSFLGAGIDPDTLLFRERTGQVGHRTYTYRIADELIAEISPNEG